MRKVVVFDIDRTLVDSYIPELLSLQEAIKNVTGITISEDDFKRLTTLPTSAFFKSLGLSSNQVELINREWENTFSKYKTVCFPGLKDIIKKLALKGYTFGVITSRTIDEYHELDKELEDIKDYIKSIITSDKIHNPKPDKESMDLLCQELQCSPNDVIYIGDSIVDKTFAENAKVEFIPACWESKELENEYNACFKTEDILRIIEGE